VDVLFFGESPGREEVKEGHAFVGPAGQRMRELIEYEIPDKTCVLDNICPRFLNGAKPMAKEMKEFESYRKVSIAKHRPRVICLLGKDATKAFGIKGKPVGNVGRIVQWKGYNVVLSIHPSYTLRSPEKIDLFKDVFRSIKRMLTRQTVAKIRRIQDYPELVKFLDRTAKKPCAFDLETSSLDPKDGRILCCSITVPNMETAWVGLYHPESWHKDIPYWMAKLCKWWGKGSRIIQNAKFELAWMREAQRECGLYGSQVSGQPKNPFEVFVKDPTIIYDTMIQSWLINENSPKNLNWQVVQTLNRKPYWQGIPEGGGFSEVPLEVLGTYCGNDTWHTMALHNHQQKILTTDQIKLADELFTPLAKILVQMEEAGIKIDVATLDKLRKSQRAKATRLNKRAESLFPGVNFGSPTQMRELLFKKLKLKSGTWTKGGAKKRPVKSTDADVLANLCEQEPNLKRILEANKAESVLTRILIPWKEKHITDEGFIHTNFNVAATTTGRLSSSNPNMQNPQRGESVERRCMVSRFKGGKLVQLDYSQHEYRIQGAVADDQEILKIFRQGLDPHRVTTDDITARGVTINRATGKNINFAVLFEITGKGLYRKYGIPSALGNKLIKLWYAAHPKVVEFHKDLEKQMRERGWVENVFGMRRHLDDPSNGHERRQAYNFPVQGPAVLICFLSMIEIQKWLDKRPRLRSLIIHQMHDDVILDCPMREVKQVAPAAKKIMEHVDLSYWVGKRPWSKVPLAVDVKIGDHL